MASYQATLASVDPESPLSHLDATAVFPQSFADISLATQLAHTLSLPVVTAEDVLPVSVFAFLLVVDGDRVALRCVNHKAFGEIVVDFVTGANAYRRKHSGAGQDIARAIGVAHRIRPRVLDACAGLGRDAFVLASLGCEVVLFERHPVVHALLENGLQRARQFAHDHNDTALQDTVARMQLLAADAHHMMSSLVAVQQVDVIYLDPMFPERRKVAAVKKEMAAFHSLVGTDDDAAGLLSQALLCDVCRVVVKRPRLAALLDEKNQHKKPPSHQITGKSTRYDVYVRRSLARPE